MNEWEWQVLEDKNLVEEVRVDGIFLRRGDRVRLRPQKGGDVLDIALRGQIATVETIEQDYEGKAHICVVLDDDPGRDLGLLRQTGHRFFFRPSEVEPLLDQRGPETAKNAGQPGILIAGIGNIFMGDDGFGVEVAKALTGSSLPPGVRVADFGIRGLDLAYALQDGYETTILIDAFSRGEAPGTIYVVEPDLHDPAASFDGGNFVEPHAMHPVNVLRMAAAMDASPKHLFLIGCEPMTTDGEDGQIGLSPPVKAGVAEAVRVVKDLVERVLSQRRTTHKSQG